MGVFDFEPTEKKPMDWVMLEIGYETVFSDKGSKKIKGILRKEGIEVRKLPFGFSENIVYIRNKDLPKSSKLIKRKIKSLKEVI